MFCKSPAWSLNNIMQDCSQRSTAMRVLSSRYAEVETTFYHQNEISGTLRTFTMPQMELSHLELVSAHDIFTMQTDGIDRCTGTFICTGRVRSNLTDYRTTLQQEAKHHSFVHVNTEETHHCIGAGHTHIIYLNINPAALNDLLPDWECRKDGLYKTGGAGRFWISPSVPFSKNSGLVETLSAIMRTSFTGSTRSLYLEAKSLELLALQLKELQVSALGSSSRSINRTDEEKLIAVREYINSNYMEPISLHSLSRQFLLNEFKLKKGFRQLFHQTTFNYIHHLRMERAKSLLQDQQLNVNEVSDLVGYSSIHNFSNAFYKKYRFRPSVLKNCWDRFSGCQ